MRGSPKRVTGAMDDADLTQLAKAGGICDCGGVHITNIDQALLAVQAALPFCECECPICEPFASALERIIRQNHEPNADEVARAW